MLYTYICLWKRFDMETFQVTFFWGSTRGGRGEQLLEEMWEHKKFEKWGEKTYVKLCETKSGPIKMWSFNFSEKNDGQFLNCDNTYDTLVFIAKLIFLQRRFSCKCETYADKHGRWLPASLKIKRDVKGREMLGEPEIWMAVDICLLLIVCVPVCVIVNVIDAIGKTKC